MFRDKEEELQRLQAELLQQDEPDEPEELPAEEDEELLDEEELDELLKDTRATQDTIIYQNFSNEYGKQLRNFANNYKAYNTDKLDLDPEELSRQLDAPKRNTGLLATAALLAVAVLAMVCYLLLRYRGLL